MKKIAVNLPINTLDEINSITEILNINIEYINNVLNLITKEIEIIEKNVIFLKMFIMI